MKNKTIIVTGAAGFIGSHLCERLAKDNNVIGLDNYFTGSTDNHVPNVTYIEGNTKNINALCKHIHPDIVYHLGEYSRVEQSFEDVETVLDYNMTGIQAVLSYVRARKCKIVYAGSSTKYADLGKNACPYSWSKATNTELVKNYGEWFDVDYAITYFYNVYGPREIQHGKYATLIAKFNQKMIDKEPLTVVLPGTQRRNFTHIYDTVDALVLIGEKGQGDEYGIGNPQSFSIFEVAELYGAPIEMLPPRKGNRMTAPVISDKTIALGWKPTRDLVQYINTLKGE